MNFVQTTLLDGVATVNLCRGKVNALNESTVEELSHCFQELEIDPNVKAAILTGTGRFFSFGFDIPEFLGYSKEAFIGYLEKFTALYRLMFLFPKPLVVALNGHTIAGGCMLALTGDHRLMVPGKAKISLNEIAFGSSVFAGAVEMLTYAVGTAQARKILFSGSMYSAEEALKIGLIDQMTSENELLQQADRIARDLAEKDGAAFKSIKHLLRIPPVEKMDRREKDAIFEFADIWYSPETWQNLQEIKIHA